MGSENNVPFMQEKIKHKPIYQKRTVQKALLSIVCGALFGLTALAVWAVIGPRIDNRTEEAPVQPIEIPEEEENEPDQEEATVYITETVSMELEDYKKIYQQLMQIGNQVERSLANISVITVDKDWFDETYTSQSSVSGMIIGDNGLELLLLTKYSVVGDGGDLLISFYDHTTASGVLKKYDRNTGLAVVSVNLSDISQETRDIIQYADLGSSKTLRSGEPVIAVGSPVGSYGSLLYGYLTTASQTASLYDASYNILTTDMTTSSSGSGVLVNWSGKIIGLIQDQYTVSGQKNTIQAYGISDLKDVIEHLSNNQDIVYMGILGADVTTSVSEAEDIPIGVYVSEVALNSPAIEAGIQPGDVLTAISGQPVTNLKDVKTILLKCSNEQEVQVICKRLDKTGYQDVELSVKLKILE